MAAGSAIRHTFYSWLAMAGASIKEIQEAAGHKTITMSARYSHLPPRHKQSAVERIAGTATKQPPASGVRSRKTNSRRNSRQAKTASRNREAF